MNRQDFLKCAAALWDVMQTSPDVVYEAKLPGLDARDLAHDVPFQQSERPDYASVRTALRDVASQARDAVDIRLDQVASLYNGVRPNRVRIANVAPFVDNILQMMYEDCRYERSMLNSIVHVMSDYDTEAERIKPDWLGCIPRPLLYCFCVNWCYRVDMVTTSKPEAVGELHQLGFCVALSNTFAVRVSFTVENNSVYIRQI